MSSELSITTRSQTVGDSYMLFLDSRLNLEHKLCQTAHVNFLQIMAGLNYVACYFL